MTEKWDRRFLDLAAHFASFSKDPSTQVGAVIAAENHRVLSSGYNGFPAMMPDKTEYYHNRDEKYSRIIHGEVNALLFAPLPLPPDCTLYTWPFLPCDRCVVMMLQAGIKRFVSKLPTEDAISRWGEAFTKTRGYIVECGGSYIEL